MATMPPITVRLLIDAGDPATSALAQRYVEACERSNALPPTMPRVAIQQAIGQELAAGRALFAALMQVRPVKETS